MFVVDFTRIEENIVHPNEAKPEMTIVNVETEWLGENQYIENSYAWMHTIIFYL